MFAITNPSAGMRFDVVLTEDAHSDLEELHDYVAEHDTADQFDIVLM